MTAAPPAQGDAIGGGTAGRRGLQLIGHGLVQGVGFRPAVHRLAAALGLDGSLTNSSGAVHLELAGSLRALETFLQRLPQVLPAPARLDRLEVHWLSPPLPPSLAAAAGLRITATAPRPLGEGWRAASLVPDLAPCPDCRAELADPRSRRFRYPFLSCSRCGPRYSIALAEPWCRAHTTLAPFPLCDACRAEFADPGDRRFHAETIACPACGPRLHLQPLSPPLPRGCRRPAAGDHHRPWDSDPAPTPSAAAPASQSWPPPIRSRRRCDPPQEPSADPLEAAAALLRQGGILALQGVGGFQLLVDASDARAVARLRRRKRRPGKPLALLVADIDWLAPLVQLTPAERAALEHPAAPIVLLRRQPGTAAALPGVAPGSPALGVMLPASPLHLLLSRAVGRPLVCTSGNRSGEPLCTDPQEAAERLTGIADGLLSHDRAIARPLDDSLLQLIEDRPALLRRARGYAPEPLRLPSPPSGCRDFPGPAHPGPPDAQGRAPAEGRRQAPAGDGDGAGGRAAGRDPAPQELPVIALGGDLKSAPALALGEHCWLAPHLGDLGEERHLRRLQRGLAEWLTLAGPAGVSLACDAHPGYLSRQLADAIALAESADTSGDSRGAPAAPSPPPAIRVRAVPHHLAHGMAVVAEHGLRPPLLLLACDGLGYGVAEPGGPAELPRLRGCEVMLLESGASAPGDGSAEGAGEQPARRRHAIVMAEEGWRARTLASLRPFPLPGGERAVGEPRRCALGLLSRAGALDHAGAWRLRQAFAAGERQLLLQALASGCQSPETSSLGRLFDAAASLLGLVQVLSHEGQGGLRLQAAAERGLARAGVVGADLLPLRPAAAGGLWLDWQPLLAEMLGAAAAGGDRQRAAARFHLALAEGLAEAMAELARRHGLWGHGRRRSGRSGGDPPGGAGATEAAAPQAHGGAGDRAEADPWPRDRRGPGPSRSDCRADGPCVALGGGCFQNRLLLEATAAALRRRGLRPCWGEALPGNDGGLALGQIWAVRRLAGGPGQP